MVRLYVTIMNILRYELIGGSDFMNMNLVNEITASQIRTDLPSFSSGDTVKVHVRITEGDKSRTQEVPSLRV